MAKFTAVTDVKSVNTNQATQHLALTHMVRYGGDSYYHFKTNIGKNTNRMFMIEAVGYAYGSGSAIRCAWSGYPYSGSGTIINTQLRKLYPGLTPDGVYYSSDNYVVLRASASSYFSGWILNSYTPSPAGYAFQVRIQESVQTSESGAYY